MTCQVKIYLLIYLFIYLFIHLFIYLFIYLFSCLYIKKLIIFSSKQSVLLLVLGNTACRQACPLIYDPHCGDDGKTYSNLCVLEIAQCENHSIALLHKGKCKGMSMQCRAKLIPFTSHRKKSQLSEKWIFVDTSKFYMKGDKTFIKNFNTTVNFDPETYLGLSQTLKELFCEHSKKNFKKSSIIDF